MKKIGIICSRWKFESKSVFLVQKKLSLGQNSTEQLRNKAHIIALDGVESQPIPWEYARMPLLGVSEMKTGLKYPYQSVVASFHCKAIICDLT